MISKRGKLGEKTKRVFFRERGGEGDSNPGPSARQSDALRAPPPRLALPPPITGVQRFIIRTGINTG